MPKLLILSRVRRRPCALWREQRGATAVEYGLIVAAIALAAAGALSTVGVTIGDVFETISINMLSAR